MRPLRVLSRTLPAQESRANPLLTQSGSVDHLRIPPPTTLNYTLGPSPSGPAAGNTVSPLSFSLSGPTSIQIPSTPLILTNHTWPAKEIVQQSIYFYLQHRLVVTSLTLAASPNFRSSLAHFCRLPPSGTNSPYESVRYHWDQVINQPLPARKS